MHMNTSYLKLVTFDNHGRLDLRQAERAWAELRSNAQTRQAVPAAFDVAAATRAAAEKFGRPDLLDTLALSAQARAAQAATAELADTGEQPVATRRLAVLPDPTPPSGSEACLSDAEVRARLAVMAKRGERQEQVRAAFIGLGANTEAVRAVATDIANPTGALLEASAAWGVRGDALRGPLNNLAFLMKDTRAGQAVLPEVVGAQIYFALAAIDEAKIGASPAELERLVETEDALIGAMERATGAHGAVPIEAHWAAEASRAQEAARAQERAKLHAAAVAWNTYMMSGVLPPGAVIPRPGLVFLPERPPAANPPLELPGWLKWLDWRRCA